MMDKPRPVFRDYYYVLGLKPGATQGQIQAAFDELYEKFGPHVNTEELDPDAMAKAYKDISEAYEVLMDPARRREYDKKAEQSRQDSNDLRDLWLKKTGMPTQEHATDEAQTPQSWVKRNTGAHLVPGADGRASTRSGSHPAVSDDPSWHGQAASAGETGQGRGDSANQPNYGSPAADAEYGSPQVIQGAQGTHGQETSSQGIYDGAHNDASAGFINHGDGSSGSHEGRTASESYDTHSPKPAIALEVDVLVTLKEAFKGCKKEVTITDPVTCSECAGLNNPVHRMQCAQCRGIGTYNIDRKEELELPAGMYQDMEISMPGQGRYDVRAGHNGDLIVRIRLAEHTLLGTNGKDITCSVPVTIYEAMLGAEIEAPCATGKVTMKIQPLTQPGRIYRLKGLGLAGSDQLVTIEVVLPARLSADEVAAYKRLREMHHEPNPRQKYFQQR